MTRVFFVVIETASGNVLRTGQCESEDAGLQGEMVLIFDQDPRVSGVTHRWAADAEAFVPIKENNDD